MDQNQPPPSTGGGGPAPFLVKTYEMVDDNTTDEIVSWSTRENSFVVWDPPEFSRLLLPMFFKHSNFSSFIRQLNTYGFRKIDPEKWEFANEGFLKDKKHLLKNIHRKKPVHSHSTPQTSTVDPERAAFEEEIDKLKREKTSLEKNLLRYKQQQPASKFQLEDLTQRVNSMEQRQDSLPTFLQKAAQNPEFVEHLAQKLESIDFSADNKKRRLPTSRVFPDDGVVDNQSPQSPARPDYGNVSYHEFSGKLRLELSPAVSDVNIVSNSTRSSNEDGGSSQFRLSEGCTRTTEATPGRLLELSDTGTSFAFNIGSSLTHKTGPTLDTNEETEGHPSCQLNLTLASSVSQINPCPENDTIPQSFEDIGKPPSENVPSKPKLINKVAPAEPTAVPTRVNDVFWEQFLTERPGSSDVDDTSPNITSTTPSNEQNDQRSGHGSYGHSSNLPDPLS